METIVTNSDTGEVYTIEKQLSKGKFGKVFQAILKDSNKRFILKESASIHQDVLTRLQKINHPALQTSTQMIRTNQKSYLIRPYEDGISLKEFIANRKYYPNFFWIKAFIYLLEGLEQLHANNLIHRDIKPGNIILPIPVKTNKTSADPTKIRLIDFEQTLIIGLPMQAWRAPFALCYSPPEQLLNRNHLTGPWSDLFSLAMTLYETLCRKPAFWYHDPEMLMHMQLNQPIKNNGIKQSLFAIIVKATYREPFRLPPRALMFPEIDDFIQKSIEKRYQEAREFITDLENLINTYNQSH